MTVYYTQILNKDSRKILSGDYSPAGVPLKTNKTLLYELKDAMKTVSYDSEKIYSYNSQSGNYVFYFQFKSSYLLASITDKKTGAKDISRYFESLIGEYMSKHTDSGVISYEFDDSIRKLSDDYNKKHKLNKGVEELENAHNILVENLDTLVNRGENINNLKSMADKVNFETREMSRRVNQIKRNAQIEKYKIYGVIAVVLIIILYFLFS
jgi:uncharacterized protein (UPF0218 family)